MKRNFKLYSESIKKKQEELRLLNVAYENLLVKVDNMRFEIITKESELERQSHLLHKEEVKERFKRNSNKLKHEARLQSFSSVKESKN